MPYGNFEESQRFSQVWLWIVLVGVSSVVLFQVPNALIFNSGDESMSTTNILITVFSVLFIIAINTLFFYARLNTKINNDTIEITFHPFINKPIIYHWADIDQAFVRKYNSLWEYGGWGIRFTWKGRAYNTSGNKGLQLILNSGKKILIGTHKPEELDDFLKKYIFTKNQDYQ